MASGGDMGNKQRRLEIVQRTKKCGLCPMHDRENRGRRPKPDKYKSKRKGRLR